MIHKVLIFVALSQIILGDVRLETIRLKLENPEIYIYSSFLYRGKSHFKNLDKIRSRYQSRKIRKKSIDDENYNSCADAKTQALRDSKNGILKLINFRRVQGYFDPKYYLYLDLLGIEIVKTGCVTNRWSECYNEKMQAEIRHKYDKDVFDILSELENYQNEKYLIDIEKKELIEVDRIPSLGNGLEKFNKKIRSISCQRESQPILYMLYEIEINKRGATENVRFIKGSEENGCMRKIKRVLENYEEWQPAEKQGQPISTIVKFQMLI